MRIARARRHDGAAFALSHDGETWQWLDDFGTRAESTRAVIEYVAAEGDRLVAALAERPGGAQLTPSALLSPVVGAGKVLGVGRNYRAHVEELARDLPTEPILFTKWPNSLCGPFDDIEVDRGVTDECDYEVELAVLIGREAKNLPVERACDVVFGYAVTNDVTARDLQRRSTTWDRAKGLDTFGPVGPWITTAEQVPDWEELELRAEVNGSLVQHARAGEMLFGVPELIAYASWAVTLQPGDVLLTGTPSGVGAGAGPDGHGFLQEGDVVACEIDGLGRLENRVVHAAPSPARTWKEQ